MNRLTQWYDCVKAGTGLTGFPSDSHLPVEGIHKKFPAVTAAAVYLSFQDRLHFLSPEKKHTNFWFTGIHVTVEKCSV